MGRQQKLKRGTFKTDNDTSNQGMAIALDTLITYIKSTVSARC